MCKYKLLSYFNPATETDNDQERAAPHLDRPRGRQGRDQGVGVQRRHLPVYLAAGERAVAELADELKEQGEALLQPLREELAR